MLTTEWLSAFAPVGIAAPDGQFAATGAGVFFHRENELWIVTANHVLSHMPNLREFAVLIPPSSGEKLILVGLGVIQTNTGISWVRDEANDLAASLMPYSGDFGIKAIGPEFCLSLSELLPSMPCYTIGCPYGLRGMDATSHAPLVLDGVISGVDKSTRRIYTSAPTFPGNSGGPLVAIRTPFNPAGGMVFGRPTVLLAGIVLRTAIVGPASSLPGMPPLHLGVAVSMDAVLELLKSPQAQAQVDLVKPK